MLYMGTPSGETIKMAMSRGEVGCMTTPSQGNRIPDGAWWAADNGKFGKGWPGVEKWWEWLQRKVEVYGPGRCLWALAPDVPFNAAGTLEESLPWLARIRELGIPAAFAAQDGCENGLIPWGQFDVLFLAGSTEWKTGPVAEKLCWEARTRGVKTHMGRVNTRGRLRIAEWFGCYTCDGTTFAWGGDPNWWQLSAWTHRLQEQPSLNASDSMGVTARTSNGDGS
jgi:hypothetical protein